MKTNVKRGIGILVMLAAGFVGFQVLKPQSPDIEDTELIVKVVKPEHRHINASPFVERTSETGMETQREGTTLSLLR